MCSAKDSQIDDQRIPHISQSVVGIYNVSPLKELWEEYTDSTK